MKPIPGSLIFNALKNKQTIIMACNTRMTIGIVKGIMRAAKDLDSAIIFELARSESDLYGGYTGLTPNEYSKCLNKISEEVGFNCWALHGDHITVKTGTSEEIEEVKKLIKAQIDAGYTSFAIDASYLFNFKGNTVEEELADNIMITTELAKFIKNNKTNDFGLEVEVGEIGRKNDNEMVLTKPEEAVAFIKVLNANGVYPQLLAIANGSSHGNLYDKKGELCEQVSIDIPLTIAVAESLKENNLHVGIAQHGITGTPRNLISEKFPKGKIIKGNVGTFWQNIVWEVLEREEPELYKEIWNWTITNYKQKMPGKKDKEIFGKYSKLAIKVFKSKIYSIKKETAAIIENRAYEEAKEWIHCFNSQGTASIVLAAKK